MLAVAAAKSGGHIGWLAVKFTAKAGMAQSSPAPAGKEWFDGGDSSSADIPPLGSSPAPATAADPNNAVANAAAGMLGAAVMDKVPFLGAAMSRVSSTLNINEQMKQLQYGPWGDFLMPAGGYTRPSTQELRGKVMTNVASYGGCVPANRLSCRQTLLARSLTRVCMCVCAPVGRSVAGTT